MSDIENYKLALAEIYPKTKCDCCEHIIPEGECSDYCDDCGRTLCLNCSVWYEELDYTICFKCLDKPGRMQQIEAILVAQKV